MFQITITSLNEFRIFIKIIKGLDLDENEIKNLSQSLSITTDKLLDAEQTQEGK